MTLSHRHGLSTAEVIRRQQQYGSNQIETEGRVLWWRILLRQVSNSLTLVLAIAMILSYATMDWIEGGVITAVILLNIIVGFFQDYRAEQTIASLLAMAAPTCKVVRDNGSLQEIKAEQLVPGDIVQLGVGNVVPADVRLTNSINFATDEAALTGESKPAAKDAEWITDIIQADLGDRHNIA